MFLRKAQAGSAPDVTWHNDGDIREVSDCLGWELLAIPEGGFSEVAGPDPDPEPETPEAFDEIFDQGEPVEVVDSAEEPEPASPSPAQDAPEPRRGGRPRLPRDENGNIIRKTETGE